MDIPFLPGDLGALGASICAVDLEDGLELPDAFLRDDGDGAWLDLDLTGGSWGTAAGSAGPATASPSTRPLRCLDRTHAERCAVCMEAPQEGEFTEFQLLLGSSDAGAAAPSAARKGDKQASSPSSAIKCLRALVLQTEEWGCTASREAAADAEEARGDPLGVAVLLRSKQSRALCKHHLLHLCRVWGYKSHIWHRVRSKAAAKRGRDSPPSVSCDTAALVPRPLASPEALAVAPASMLQPLWRAAAQGMSGEACKAECVRCGVAFYNTSIDAEFQLFDSASAVAATTIRALREAQVAWNCTVLRSLARDARSRGPPLTAAAIMSERMPAFSTAAFTADGLTPVEQAMRGFVAASTQFHAAWRARRQSAAPVLAACAPDMRLEPIDAEAEAMYADTAQFFAEAMLVLAYLKARGCVSDYLSTCVATLDEVSTYMAAIRRNMQGQRSWYLDQMQQGTLRPLEKNVAEYNYDTVWGGVASQCQQVAMESTARVSTMLQLQN